jgi:hypothetical protein
VKSNNYKKEGTLPKKLRNSAVPSRMESIWFKVDHYGDEQEFLHFTSLFYDSFHDLCILTEPVLKTLPPNRDDGTPLSQDLQRQAFPLEI